MWIKVAVCCGLNADLTSSAHGMSGLGRCPNVHYWRLADLEEGITAYT